MIDKCKTCVHYMTTGEYELCKNTIKHSKLHMYIKHCVDALLSQVCEYKEK